MVDIREWYQKCEKIITPILQKIDLDKKTIKKYFSRDFRDKWETCFTHKSADMLKNYERVEFLGDELLDFTFSLYLKNHYGGKFSEGEMTELKRLHMSKDKQPDMARRLKINKLLIYNEEIPSKIINFDSICEDLYEAFFYTVFEISNEIETNSGLEIVLRIIEETFADIEIKREEGKGHSKNRVNQTFQILASSSKNANTNIVIIDGLYVSRIYVPNRAKSILKNYNIILPELLGEGKSRNKSEAQLISYDNALQTLLDNGLDRNKTIHIKSLITLDKLSDKKLKRDFTKKLNENDYVSFQVEDQKFDSKNEEDGTIVLFYLYGINNKGKKERLSFLYMDNNYDNVLEMLIRKYLEE